MICDIVPYEEKYKQSLFEFTDSCFEELGKKFEPYGRHSFYNDIRNEFTCFYCLVSDDAVRGTVGLKRIDEDTAELKAMYLDEDYRGQGFGRRLMDTVIDEARKRGFRSIVLDSMSKYIAALKLYEKAGFVKTERYNDNPYADIFMRLDLTDIKTGREA